MDFYKRMAASPNQVNFYNENISQASLAQGFWQTRAHARTITHFS